MIGDIHLSVSFPNQLVKKYDLCETACSDICNKNHNYFGGVKIQSEDSLPTFLRILMYEPHKAWLLLYVPPGLTFKNSKFCSHFMYVFCMDLRTNRDLCHLQQKLIDFYNRDEKCLQRRTDWVFK